MDSLCNFEKQVAEGFKECGIPLAHSGRKLGIAVSGGADSVSLLLACVKLLQNHESEIKVITVNHNIREESETTGDALFVEQLCRKISDEGKQVSCDVITLERGLVSSLAEERGLGIEEAARFLRYEAFDRFIKENQLDVLCLAHNRNDQVETLLMRFVQGSSLDGGAGITNRRGKYIRPLLNISRTEIENYLKETGQSWRTDKSNFDTVYLRNKIRNRIIPVLNEELPGWDKAVISGGKKNQLDLEIIEKLVNEVPFVYNADLAEVIFNRTDFDKKERCIKSRLLYKACNLAGSSGRISTGFIDDVLDSLEKSENNFVKRSGNIEIVVKSLQVFVKKTVKLQTDFVFFDIIEENGFFTINETSYKVEDSVLYVVADINHNKLKSDLCICSVDFPFCIRSFQSGDVIETSEKGERKIADIFSDWHVPEEIRSLIPVIQELKSPEQKVKGILGSLFGFKDWIVKVI